MSASGPEFPHRVREVEAPGSHVERDRVAAHGAWVTKPDIRLDIEPARGVDVVVERATDVQRPAATHWVAASEHLGDVHNGDAPGSVDSALPPATALVVAPRGRSPVGTAPTGQSGWVVVGKAGAFRAGTSRHDLAGLKRCLAQSRGGEFEPEVVG